MHTRHSDKGFVIEEYEKKDHDKVFKVFARENGTVFLTARGIRRPQSKMKPFLLPGSYITFECVRGRKTNVLVGITNSNNLSIEDSVYRSQFISLLTSTTHILGKKEDDHLFDILLSYYTLLTQKDDTKLNQEEMTRLHDITFALALAHGGYFDKEKIMYSTFKSKSDASALLTTLRSVSRKVTDVQLALLIKQALLIAE